MLPFPNSLQLSFQARFHLSSKSFKYVTPFTITITITTDHRPPPPPFIAQDGLKRGEKKSI
ncbi:unnamed protein product [Tuber melanosporum]|uniref:(Perigord truffle) hypothetical protein n=1 Tax=Tuber melanosporum (strain Mel28) TaxID=656061 RepID=D5GKT9_TUBMM|nr:uncharacterized protein GSTUM_00009767001 [Tuber melanosporum]CAZ85132.1 unnamed protein product [Tuber melanosporum]